MYCTYRVYPPRPPPFCIYVRLLNENRFNTHSRTCNTSPSNQIHKLSEVYSSKQSTEVRVDCDGFKRPTLRSGTAPCRSQTRRDDPVLYIKTSIYDSSRLWAKFNLQNSYKMRRNKTKIPKLTVDCFIDILEGHACEPQATSKAFHKLTSPALDSRVWLD